ncbi:DUF1960-domain-containing protein [Rhizodiscina lignyota]|uniref:DUF1960-domain-containing protein n=1 Tax=Rhizodiscina lignyota TaxID=1504668 RepID=A0A9P4IEX2_9PEZI|nr:DUF1960-domain-containing protein [Rhizodiscina lignyota]
MTRADGMQSKVHFKGDNDDFVIIVQDIEQVKKWKEDKSIPLVDVVDSFDVFCTHKQGVQGKLDRASNAELENEFGTHKEDDVVKMILEKGNLQETKGHGRQGDRNTMNGPMIGAATEVHN